MLLERRRRLSDSKKSGAYGLFGGGADSGESLIQNIKQGLFEEITHRFKWFDFGTCRAWNEDNDLVKIVAKGSSNQNYPMNQLAIAGFTTSWRCIRCIVLLHRTTPYWQRKNL